jgi:hypothetical protein
MEMHIVNTLSDSVNANKPSYLVLAVLFKIGVGKQIHQRVPDKIPSEEGKRIHYKPAL